MLLRNIQDVTDVIHMLLDFEILYICVSRQSEKAKEKTKWTNESYNGMLYVRI